MIVLDTNIVSAFTRRTIDPVARTWLDQFSENSAWTTAINLLEIEFGIEREKDQYTKASLRLRNQRFLERVIGTRVLALDRNAAVEAGRIRAARDSIGRTIEYRDAMIAAIVIVNAGILVTRNTRHFADLGLELINPWAET